MVAFSVLCTNSPIHCRKWLLKIHDAVLDIDEADSLIGCGAFVLKKEFHRTQSCHLHTLTVVFMKLTFLLLLLLLFVHADRACVCAVCLQHAFACQPRVSRRLQCGKCLSHMLCMLSCRTIHLTSDESVSWLLHTVLWD